MIKRNKAPLAMALIGVLFLAITTTACTASTKKTATKTTSHSSTTQKTADVIRPLYPLKKASDALADGGYSVSFTADDLIKKDNGYALTVQVYEYDRYEKKAIQKLSVGSQIQFCNKTISVKTLQKDAKTGWITINGGIENGGIELMEDDGLYRTVTMDDYPIYYSIGQITIPLSKELTFEDHSDYDKEPDGEIIPLNDFPKVVKNNDVLFNCTNTVITVRKEQIIQIIRYWTP